MTKILRGKDINLKSCTSCGQIVNTSTIKCITCNKIIYIRKKNNYNITLSLLITSLILYIITNFLPMFIFHKLGSDSNNTILQGITILYQQKMYLIATIVLIASFFIPIFKIFSLFILLIYSKADSGKNISKKIILYRIIEKIGRWSMLDIFVISVMLTLLNVGPFLNVSISWGTTVFGLVVILTKITSNVMDPRLLWDIVYE